MNLAERQAEAIINQEFSNKKSSFLEGFANSTFLEGAIDRAIHLGMMAQLTIEDVKEKFTKVRNTLMEGQPIVPQHIVDAYDDAMEEIGLNFMGAGLKYGGLTGAAIGLLAMGGSSAAGFTMVGMGGGALLGYGAAHVISEYAAFENNDEINGTSA